MAKLMPHFRTDCGNGYFNLPKLPDLFSCFHKPEFHHSDKPGISLIQGI